MSIFSSPFLLGTVTGISTRLDEGLQDSLKKTDERIEKAALRTDVERREGRKKLREQEEAIDEVLKGIAGFINVEDLPPGVTVEDAAAAIFSNQAGGSVSRGTTLVNALTESQLKGRDPGLILDKVKATGMSPNDITKQFLTFPDLTPTAPVMGSGFLKKKDLTSDIMAAVEEPALPTAPTERADFGMGRFDLTKTSQAVAAKQAEELTSLQIQTAKLTLDKTAKEIAEMGGLDEVTQRYYLKDVLAKAGLRKGFALDNNDNVIFKTTPEKLQASKDAFSEALEAATNYFNDTGTTNKTSGKNSLLGFVSANLPFASSTGSATFKDGKFDPSGMTIGKIYSYKVGGQNMNGLWLGDEFLPITGFN